MDPRRDDEPEILPDVTSDERADEDESNDQRLIEDRPPHWD